MTLPGPEAVARDLREEARRLGADLVGVAPAELPPDSREDRKAYERWLSEGRHAQMAYMARAPEDRTDIRRWFPGARSVVLCAFSYHDGKSAPPKDPLRGRLARYCLPPDYHDLLKERMELLRAWLTGRIPGLQGRVFVDSSPVFERLYARHAGIGWTGKNSMIVSEKIGSFFLLAGLAVDADLPPSPPAPDRCGSCERCLRACPCGAFPSPRVLDAGRCAAYLTVEHRDRPLPEGLREALDDRVFGCDACLDACPWNRFAVRGSVLVPEREASLGLQALAGMEEEEFRRAYAGTPLRRTGRRTLVRNALLAMGNSGDPRHRPMLERFSGGDDPILAEQARWSLKKLAFDRISPG